MVSSLPLNGQNPRVPNNTLPSPFDPGLNSWLDRSLPFDQSLNDKHWEAFTPTRPTAAYQTPTPVPRAGSMKDIVQQRNQLQQDTFQRRTVEAVNNKRTELEIPQKDPLLQGQLQQLSDGVRSFMRNLDRVNVVDNTLREAAAATQMAANLEGRKQAQREGAKSLMERIMEIATVTKTGTAADAVKKPKKENKRVDAIDERSDKEANLAVGEIPNQKEQ